jgi:hypothetical protein
MHNDHMVIAASTNIDVVAVGVAVVVVAVVVITDLNSHHSDL